MTSPDTAARVRFGQTAIQKGYVTQNEVDEALVRQKDIRARNEPHKLIGMIMLEMGALGTTELIEVLRELNVPADPAK